MIVAGRKNLATTLTAIGIILLDVDNGPVNHCPDRSKRKKGQHDNNETSREVSRYTFAVIYLYDNDIRHKKIIHLPRRRSRNE